MKITCSEKLMSYMQRKGYHCIALEPISPQGCCADMTELHSRFVRDKDVAKLKAKNCGVFEAPFGELLILERGLELDECVYFDLRRFLGVSDIVVKGIRPFSL